MPGAPSRPRGPTRFTRAGGAAGVAGASFLVLGGLAAGTALGFVVLAAVVPVLLVVSLLALHARLGPRGRRLRALALAVVLLGVPLVPALGLGFVVMAAGAGLFAAASLRSGALPAGPPRLLAGTVMGAALAGAVAEVVAGVSGPVVVAAILAFAAAWAWWAWGLWSESREPAETARLLHS